MADLVQAHPDIALMGRARAGKDTVAAYLVEKYGYVRVAFADPLKDIALKLDPLVPTGDDSFGQVHTRLSVTVSVFGWEHAKDRFPEVRRILQHMGQGVRDMDEDFWLRAGLSKIYDARDSNRSVVITDCRYPNEYEELAEGGFAMVRVTRPWPRAEAAHISESAIDCFAADSELRNTGSIPDLHRAIDDLLVH